MKLAKLKEKITCFLSYVEYLNKKREKNVKGKKILRRENMIKCLVYIYENFILKPI
jgi:hypothetical protein